MYTKRNNFPNSYFTFHSQRKDIICRITIHLNNKNLKKTQRIPLGMTHDSWDFAMEKIHGKSNKTWTTQNGNRQMLWDPNQSYLKQYKFYILVCLEICSNLLLSSIIFPSLSSFGADIPIDPKLVRIRSNTNSRILYINAKIRKRDIELALICIN